MGGLLLTPAIIYDEKIREKPGGRFPCDYVSGGEV
jgi:hypothetical protein